MGKTPDPSWLWRAHADDGIRSYCILYSMEGLVNYLKEERPWGNFERFTLNEKATVKIVTVNEGESISLQTHFASAVPSIALRVVPVELFF